MLTQSWHGGLIGFNSESGWWLQGGKGAPVLLMHQEFLNGDSWFQFVDAKHVGRLLPVLLLDDGFDVWVGHQRATYWCHDHVSLHYTQQVPSSLSFLQFSSPWLYLTQRYTNRLNPPWTLLPSQHVGWFPDVRDACISMFNGLREDPWSSNHSWTLVFPSSRQAFWDWTWDEHAHYDLPAQLRFINAETNQTVHYIGISQVKFLEFLLNKFTLTYSFNSTLWMLKEIKHYSTMPYQYLNRFFQLLVGQSILKYHKACYSASHCALY